MKVKLFTNESFEKYIDRITSGKKFEDRWDTLDLDDAAADIDIPSDDEVNAAVRELDLIDDIANKTGSDVDVDSSGRIRILDLDDEPARRRHYDDPRDSRIRSLDLDDPKSHRDRYGRRYVDPDSNDEKGVELDFDDDGKKVKDKKSNLGSLGMLDYDDDVDTSNMAASIEDVYTGLTSSDPNVVKSLIKRYANDITDTQKIKEILLAHAVKLNYDSLKALCGLMTVRLSQREKELGYIDKDDVKEALTRFSNIAKTLTGENNTYGLIPNAIASCGPNDQTKCANIVDFLHTFLDLPVSPIYFRGAVVKKLYNVARLLLNELGGKIPSETLTGKRGLFARTKDYKDIPPWLLEQMAPSIISKKTPTNVIGDFVILNANNGNKGIADVLVNNLGKESSKLQFVLDYIDDTDEDIYKELAKKIGD